MNAPLPSNSLLADDESKSNEMMKKKLFFAYCKSPRYFGAFLERASTFFFSTNTQSFDTTIISFVEDMSNLCISSGTAIGSLSWEQFYTFYHYLTVFFKVWKSIKSYFKYFFTIFLFKPICLQEMLSYCQISPIILNWLKFYCFLNLNKYYYVAWKNIPFTFINHFWSLIIVI